MFKGDVQSAPHLIPFIFVNLLTRVTLSLRKNAGWRSFIKQEIYETDGPYSIDKTFNAPYGATTGKEYVKTCHYWQVTYRVPIDNLHFGKDYDKV